MIASRTSVDTRVAITQGMKLDSTFTECCWPFERAVEAVACLSAANGCGLSSRTAEIPQPSSEVVRSQELRSAWMEELGRTCNIAIDAVYEQYGRLPEFLRDCAPALLSLHLLGVPHVLAVLGASRGRLRVLAPDGNTRRIPLAVVRSALANDVEQPVMADLTAMLQAANIPSKRQAHVRSVLLEARLAPTNIALGWLVRRSRTTSVWQELRNSRMAQPLRAMLVLYALQYALLGMAWESARRGVLLGHVDHAWLMGWLLAMLSSIPVLVASTWLSARFSLEAGTWLRTRLLEGVLDLEADYVRGQGAGHLLGRIMEAGTLEAFGLGGAMLAAFVLVDIVAAGALLSQGPAPLALLAILATALAVAGLIARNYYLRRRSWTTTRLALTHDLIDRMLGHRTRAVQEPRRIWHDKEDQLLEGYLADSSRFDASAIATATLPRCFILVGFAALAIALVLSRPSQVELALSMAGLLVASRALTAFSAALAQLSSAAIAWQQAGTLLKPHSKPGAADPSLACVARSRFARSTLEARELTLQHAEGSEPILAGIDLQVRAGEHVLLQGPSGSGKTTLAHVLSGLRRAQRGLLLFNGLDRHTLGWTGWNRRVTVAPQYHDNHVLSGTFAFNVLLGRASPPSARDLADAERICQQIGLGPLLARMPAGMQQMVGETGWQLSHGERGRLFAARAILADADLVVLDESVAALDPQTASVVLRCAREHTRSLLLIAHP